MKKLLQILAISFVLLLILIFIYQQESKPHDLEVYFLDVGQGDSILIRTPDNIDILIDGGPDKKVLTEIGKILPFWDQNIELMILSHPHDDHLVGLVAVLNKYEVDKVIYDSQDEKNNNFQEFKKIIKEKNIPISQSFYGEQINFSQDLYLQIIFPFKNIDLEKIENLNNTSIVTRLVYKNNKFLFTGDVEQETEQLILQNQIDIQADILKVGHHGSKTSSSENFLDAVQPLEAVIMCGIDNKFKHPHFITLYKLNARNTNIFRTDQDKTIKCNSNGVDITCGKML